MVNPSATPIDSKYLSFLRDHGADKVQHSNRTLLDHLVGTYNLLQTWDNEQHVCLVGLFHSVYGTRTFTDGLLNLDQRALVKRLLGDKIEHWVYHFATENRDDFFTDIYNGDNDLNILIEVEIANTLEQLPHRQKTSQETMQAYKNQARKAIPFLSEGARSQVIETFGQEKF